MRGDARSFQVALVAEAQLDALLDVLEQERWGVIQLPPRELDADTARLWHEQVAEHVAELRRNDYAVVLLDDGDDGERLAALGVEPLPRLALPCGEGDVRSFLRQYAIQPPSTSRLAPET